MKMSTKFEIMRDENLQAVVDRIKEYQPSVESIQFHYKKQTLVRVAKFLFLNHLLETELELAKVIQAKLVNSVVVNGESAPVKKKKTKKVA